MSETTPSISARRRLPAHAAIYGGPAGLIGGAWVAAAFGFGYYGGFVETAGIIVPIAALVLGIMRWRDQVTGGETRFASAFGAGLAIGLIYAAVAALAFFVFARLRHETVVDQWLQIQTTYMQQQGQEPARIEEAVHAVRPQLTPVFFAKQRFVYALLVSLVVSLIAAIVVPRRRI